MNQFGLSINTIELPVSDLDTSIKWYTQALGLVCSWSDDHHAVLAIQPHNEADNNLTPKLLLVETQDSTRLNFRSTYTQILHSVVDFHTDNLTAMHSHLKEIIPDLPPLQLPANDWAPQGFGFADPDGNRIAIFCYNRL